MTTRSIRLLGILTFLILAVMILWCEGIVWANEKECNPSCNQCPEGYLQVKFESPSPGTSSKSGITIVVSEDKKYVQSWTAAQNIVVHAIVVKGGPDCNVYDSDDELPFVSPRNRGGNIPEISHVMFCFTIGELPPPPPPPCIPDWNCTSSTNYFTTETEVCAVATVKCEDLNECEDPVEATSQACVPIPETPCEVPTIIIDEETCTIEVYCDGVLFDTLDLPNCPPVEPPEPPEPPECPTCPPPEPPPTPPEPLPPVEPECPRDPTLCPVYQPINTGSLLCNGAPEVGLRIAGWISCMDRAEVIQTFGGNGLAYVLGQWGYVPRYDRHDQMEWVLKTFIDFR